MEDKKTYYKGLDETLCGVNGFQYEVGKEYTADTDDPWHWLHFAGKMTDAIRYGCRIVEVEPTTQVQRYGSDADMNAKTIRIVRELSKEEIVETLMKEKCPIYKMTRFKPSFETLLRHREHIHRCDYRSICNEFDWMTENQKRILLPKSWERTIRIHELNRMDECMLAMRKEG